MNVTLYFGSFNPVHTGHLIIANHLINFTETDEVWLVISPQSPFKKRKNLADSYDRLHLVELAIENDDKIKSCTIEFDLPVPNYTIDTLTYLQERHPDHNFSLVMGSDNIKSFHKWKNYEMLLEHYSIYVYQRPGSITEQYNEHSNVHYLEGPLLDISSSFIRKLIKEGKSIRYMVSDKVFDYISESNMYKD
jgi:nicotinate-nucleotide adenylyltransferase